MWYSKNGSKETALIKQHETSKDKAWRAVTTKQIECGAVHYNEYVRISVLALACCGVVLLTVSTLVLVRVRCLSVSSVGWLVGWLVGS